MLTTDERNDLHEQAAQLAYLAIRYADLSPLLSCDEWDGLADEMVGNILRLMQRRIDDERERIEQVKEAVYAKS